MTVVLWQIEISHYNEKARWALDYKGIPHRRRAPLPGVTAPVALALTRGRHKRLPVLRLDGRTIADSTAIVAALEEHRPDPPLMPTDPELRERALALEEFFDEQLAPEVRRLVWYHTLPDAGATAASLMTRSGPATRRLMRAVVPLARGSVRRDYGIDDTSAALAHDRVVAAMDRLEEELGTGDYLAGDRFSVADLTAASLFTPILCPPERQYPPPTLAAPLLALREQLEQRDGGQWISEMFARHRGTSAEVA